MKIRTRLAILAVAVAGPAFAQDAQMPLELEQQLDAAVQVDVAAHEIRSLAGRDRAVQAALAQSVSARVAAVLTPPARLGTVVARRANATELSMQRARRVFYAAK
jgi:hypothetical protein